MRVLITGATGFIGKHLVNALLEQGHDVSLLVREASGPKAQTLWGTRVNVVSVGASAESVVKGFHRLVAEQRRPDVVFHLATYFVAEHTVADLDPLIDANLKFGLGVLEGMARTGVRALVNAGTAWQHDVSGANRPVNLYAATKTAFEDLTRVYADIGQWSVIHLKLHDTYGPNDDRPKLIPKLMSLLKSGSRDALAMSPGEQKLDVVHVRDVVRAFALASERAQGHPNLGVESYAVSSGRPERLKDLVARLERVTGKALPVEWGARPYRAREVMEPWRGPTLPGWAPEVDFETGLRDLWNSERARS